MPTVRSDMNHIYANCRKSIEDSKMIISWLEEGYLKHTLSYLSDNLNILAQDGKNLLSQKIVNVLRKEIESDTKTMESCFY